MKISIKSGMLSRTPDIVQGICIFKALYSKHLPLINREFSTKILKDFKFIRLWITETYGFPLTWHLVYPDNTFHLSQ